MVSDFFEDSENEELEDDDIIIMHNQDTDKDEEYYHLATLDVDKKWYVVMSPVEKLDDIEDDQVLIYEIQERGGNTVFIPIEDEKRLNKVFDEFNKELEKYAAEHPEEFEDECDGCSDGHCDCCNHNKK